MAKNLIRATLAVLLFTVVTNAQTRNTGNAKTLGTCSPATTGDHNTYIFQWCGTDASQEKKIIVLLNKILAGQNDVAIKAKLDELLVIASYPSQSNITIEGDVHQQTKGDCSPSNIGSGNVNNCNVPPKINASARSQIKTGNPALPWATRFTIESTALTQLGDLRIRSDGPVLGINMSRINPDSICTGGNFVDKSDEKTVVLQVCSSEMMAPNHPVTITIYSVNPVHVLSGTFGSNTINF